MKAFIAGALLLAQPAGLFAAACPLSKGLDAARAECLANPAPVDCAYLASMEALAGADEATSSARLEAGLAHLGADTVEALLSRLNLMLLAAVEPPQGDPCIKKLVPLLMRFLSLWIGQKETPGSAFFFGPLFYPLTDSQVKILEKNNTPEMAAQIVAARQSFKEILERTENGRRMLSGEPLARAMELFKKLMDSGSPASLLQDLPNPFSLLPKGLVSLEPLGGFELPEEAMPRPNEIAALGAFKDALDAQARGRLEEALVALKRGRKILSALPGSRKTRLLRLIAPRFAAELSKELGQRATARIEGIEADAIRELGSLAGEILEAGMGSQVKDGEEAVMRTAAKMAEVLGKMDTSEMEDLYEVFSGLGFDASAFEEKPSPEKIDAARKHFQSLFGAAECQGQEKAAACAAPHVAQAAELAPDGRKQFLEVRAAWLAFKDGERSPELLERARQAIQRYEDFIDRSYQLDAALAGYLDEDVMETFRMMVDMLVGNDLAGEAFGYAEKARSWTLRRLVADGGGRRRQDAKYVENLRQATLDAAQPAAAEKELDQLENLAFQQRLENPDHYRLPSAAAPDVAAVQRSLSAGQTLLAYYFADPKRLLIWRIEADSSRLAEVDATPEEWQRLTCFRQSAAAGATSRGVAMVDLPCGLLQDGWSELHRLLIAPAGDGLREELILVPHGMLHQIAFAGLVAPDGERLVAGHRLTQVPSVSVWQMLAAAEPAAKAAGPALVLGDPPGADLPGAAREAKEVAAIFGVKPFLAGDASESLVHAKTPGPALIHLAAHARYDADRPRQSGILLAASRGRKAQDGRLTALEVEETLDLRGTSLVTLSACETGVGSLTRGDELIGLTRSFLVAGSRAVLSTLWQVDDQASARLMGSFYRRLKSGGTVAGALREAQLDLAGDPATADPYFWAGYALTGDPRAELHL